MKEQKAAPITPRLRVVLNTGGVEGLFPLLKDWSRDDLKALEADVGTWHDAHMERLDLMYGKYAMEPEFFFAKSGRQLLDKTVSGARMELAQVAAEILSVVYFYLERVPA